MGHFEKKKKKIIRDKPRALKTEKHRKKFEISERVPFGITLMML